MTLLGDAFGHVMMLFLSLAQVSQQLQEFIKNPRPADNPFIRPYSRLSLGLNILQLRLRRDMPERMADVGCELAR